MPQDGVNARDFPNKKCENYIFFMSLSCDTGRLWDCDVPFLDGIHLSRQREFSEVVRIGKQWPSSEESPPRRYKSFR